MRITKKSYWKTIYKNIIEGLFPKEHTLYNIFAYIAAFFMGSLFSFFTLNDYLDNEYILKNGVEVKVILIDKEYRNKMTINSIEYQNKVYSWGKYGIPYEIGDSITVLYSPEKDMFLPSNHSKGYILIIMWLFFLFFGASNIIRLLYQKVTYLLK